MNQSLPTKATTPIKADYRPEIDISPELNARDAAHYQSLIGILRWIVELGRMDICVEASMMASCMALPRQGHLEQVYHIFAYLKYHHNAELVFDPSEPDIPYEKFEKQEWGHTVFGMLRKIYHIMLRNHEVLVSRYEHMLTLIMLAILKHEGRELVICFY